MAEDLTLYYFPIKARSYAIQAVAQAGGVALNVRHDYNMKDADAKNALPFGQLPYLTQGDFKLAQSGAILRYVGSLAGSNGSTDREIAFSDMLIDETSDIFNVLGKAQFSADKAAEYAEAFAIAVPKQLAYLERLAPQFSTGAKKLTGEYALVAAFDIITLLEPAALDNFPLLKSFFTEVFASSAFDGIRDLATFLRRD
jgi:glutathione S-transferase